MMIRRGGTVRADNGLRGTATTADPQKTIVRAERSAAPGDDSHFTTCSFPMVITIDRSYIAHITNCC